MKSLGKHCYNLGWLLILLAVIMRMLTFSLTGVHLVQKWTIYPHTLLELGALAFLISIASRQTQPQA